MKKIVLVLMAGLLVLTGCGSEVEVKQQELTCERAGWDGQDHETRNSIGCYKDISISISNDTKELNETKRIYSWIRK